MSRLFVASMVGNLMLAISAYFLFTTNVNLNKDAGASRAKIQTYVATEKGLINEVQQCRADKVILITEHTRQISQIKAMSDARALQVRDEVSRIIAERGALERTLRTVRKPEVSDDAAERIRRVEAMFDSYITELQK